MLNLAVGIVTYNPDIDLLKKNLSSVATQFSHVILFDNASVNIKEIKTVLDNFPGEKCIICSCENVGIAKALNQIMERAESEGIEWVLTLDQDSIIPDNLKRGFVRYLELEQVAIICPKIFDRNAKIQDSADAQEELINDCITSGALTNVSIWKQLGGFDEALFIDDVDTDYCMRVVQGNYKILRVNTVLLDHAVGDIRIVKICGRSIVIYNHSAFRKYYQLRNKYYISYKVNGRITSKCLYHTLAPMIKIVLFESQKIEKLKACVKGIYDGIKMGRKIV